MNINIKYIHADLATIQTEENSNFLLSGLPLAIITNVVVDGINSLSASKPTMSIITLLEIPLNHGFTEYPYCNSRNSNVGINGT
jgi:hypothetical protein